MSDQYGTRLRVREEGRDLLVYNFRSAADASEVAAIIRGYFPEAEFVIEDRPMAEIHAALATSLDVCRRVH